MEDVITILMSKISFSHSNQPRADNTNPRSHMRWSSNVYWHKYIVRTWSWAAWSNQCKLLLLGKQRLADVLASQLDTQSSFQLAQQLLVWNCSTRFIVVDSLWLFVNLRSLRSPLVNFFSCLACWIALPTETSTFLTATMSSVLSNLVNLWPSGLPLTLVEPYFFSVPRTAPLLLAAFNSAAERATFSLGPPPPTRAFWPK